MRLMQVRSLYKFLLLMLGVFCPMGISATLAQVVQRYGAQPDIPSLERLEKMQPQERLVIAYFPYESQHWELVRQAVGEERLQGIHPLQDYLDGIEHLGFIIESQQLVREFAFYADREELLAELGAWPVELSEQERERVCSLGERYALSGIEAGAVNFPFKMLILTLKHRL